MKHYVKISLIEKDSKIMNEVRIIRFKYDMPIIDHFFITENKFFSLREKFIFPLFFDIDKNKDDIFKLLNLEEYCNF